MDSKAPKTKNLKVFFIKLISISIAIILIIHTLFNLLLSERFKQINSLLLLTNVENRQEYGDKLRESFWEAKWEIVLPILILTGVFSGYMTLVETAAFTVVYILTVEVLIYKDLPLKDLPKIIIDCATLIGGVLIILGVAMGLTSYLVDAQVPMRLLEWIQSTISSKLVFLLLLNILLLVIGCMMDIFSAIIVFVPLIAPLGIFFQIDPIHLAIIFIANLELGFFTPPIGMNLFLSAYRFNKSMPVLYNATIPFFLIRLLFVLILTYIPLLFY